MRRNLRALLEHWSPEWIKTAQGDVEKEHYYQDEIVEIFQMAEHLMDFVTNHPGPCPECHVDPTPELTPAGYAWCCPKCGLLYLTAKQMKVKSK